MSARISRDVNPLAVDSLRYEPAARAPWPSPRWRRPIPDTLPHSAGVAERRAEFRPEAPRTKRCAPDWKRTRPGQVGGRCHPASLATLYAPAAAAGPRSDRGRRRLRALPERPTAGNRAAGGNPWVNRPAAGRDARGVKTMGRFARRHSRRMPGVRHTPPQRQAIAQTRAPSARAPVRRPAAKGADRHSRASVACATGSTKRPRRPSASACCLRRAGWPSR